VNHLTKRGAKVRVLARDPANGKLPAGVTPVKGVAYDTGLMFRGFQRDSMVARPGTVDRLTRPLGRPLRTYRSFAQETMEQWQEA
jgi:hypothetical protein